MQDEMDMLKEIGSIVAAQGTIVLSEILGKKVNLSVPRTQIVSAATLGLNKDLGKNGIAVFSKLIAGMKGGIIFLLDKDDAFKLNGLLYEISEEDKKTVGMAELGMSLMKEIGNMVIGAYVTALGMMFRKVVLLAAPALLTGTIDEILGITVFSSKKDEDYQVLLVEAMFEEPKEQIKGSFYLVLTPEAVLDIKQSCRDMLEDFGK